jgi:hypothetical protein
MTLDPATKQVTNEQFSDVFCEFSRVDERRMGKDYRYGFATCSNRDWPGGRAPHGQRLPLWFRHLLQPRLGRCSWLQLHRPL